MIGDHIVRVFFAAAFDIPLLKWNGYMKLLEILWHIIEQCYVVWYWNDKTIPSTSKRLFFFMCAHDCDRPDVS